jgi:hypothetical protein
LLSHSTSYEQSFEEDAMTSRILHLLFAVGITAWGQTVPDAPPVPDCSWDGQGRSTCKFKDALRGTPTSLAGNRVIVYRRSASGGDGPPRTYLQEAVQRLAFRYDFIATVTDDPAVFTATNLADARAVIMNHGDGDVVPAGANRTALEDFQLKHGWGLLWIRSACAFITSGWPFGRQSCVQQYFHDDPSGTTRRIFLDSGTTASPDHGIKNPHSEFLLRDLPGWNGSRSVEMRDGWYCFKEPARNTPGVNVLLGYDRSSGVPIDAGCPNRSDPDSTGSANHNLAWTHRMGQGITVYNSMGHDPRVYTDHGNMGDSLLWRFIRYVAKDWCVSGSGEPGCDGVPAGVRAADARPDVLPLQRNGVLSMSIPEPGRSDIDLLDMGGRRVKTETVRGPGRLEIPGLRRGMYLARVRGEGRSRTQRIMVY